MISGGDANLRDPPQFQIFLFNFVQTYFPSAMIIR